MKPRKKVHLAAAIKFPQGLHAAETTIPASFALSDPLKLVNSGRSTSATISPLPRRKGFVDVPAATG